MYFGASVVMQHGQLCSSIGIDLPRGFIAALPSSKYYKYLGIYEADSINCPKTKEFVHKEYLRQVRKVLTSQLQGRNAIVALNKFAISILRYSATTVNWKLSKLQSLDCKTRKALTMNGGLYPWTDVDRIYVGHNLAGHGLLSVEDVVATERVALYHYLKNHSDALMRQVLSSGIVKIPSDISVAPEAFN